MRITCYPELMEVYENVLKNACDMKVGLSFISEECLKPEGFCDSAWETVFPFVESLASGKGDFYDGWMKNPASAMISCNDGFRPVSFLLETVK